MLQGRGTREPTRAVEEEVEMEIKVDEAVAQLVERKPRVAKAVPKRKFMDLLKETMDQRVTSSESLTKLMFKGLPMKEEIAMKVGSTALRQAERTYAVATPKIRVKIGNIIVDAMFDSGAGLTVRTNLMLALKTVS
jgi:hypothetical protein